ncbi:thioesterase superfamily domain-containing protein [Ditylenchus destructor]|nr:thioesterase superfamily domain-containing protein [Ditylenchus destructor]
MRGASRGAGQGQAQFVFVGQLSAGTACSPLITLAREESLGEQPTSARPASSIKIGPRSSGSGGLTQSITGDLHDGWSWPLVPARRTSQPHAKEEPVMITHVVPEGFVSLPRSSPLLDLLGPAYCRGEGLQLEIGLRADNRHANGRGTVHGGVLATLADIGMGYAMAFSSEPPLPLITASMTLDYLGAVQVGEWGFWCAWNITSGGGRWRLPR